MIYTFFTQPFSLEILDNIHPCIIRLSEIPSNDPSIIKNYKWRARGSKQIVEDILNGKEYKEYQVGDKANYGRNDRIIIKEGNRYFNIDVNAHM